MEILYYATLFVIVLIIVLPIVFLISSPKYEKNIKLEQEHLINSGCSFKRALLFAKIVNNEEVSENDFQQGKL